MVSNMANAGQPTVNKAYAVFPPPTGALKELMDQYKEGSITAVECADGMLRLSGIIPETNEQLDIGYNKADNHVVRERRGKVKTAITPELRAFVNWLSQVDGTRPTTAFQYASRLHALMQRNENLYDPNLITRIKEEKSTPNYTQTVTALKKWSVFQGLPT